MEKATQNNYCTLIGMTNYQMYVDVIVDNNCLLMKVDHSEYEMSKSLHRARLFHNICSISSLW